MQLKIVRQSDTPNRPAKRNRSTFMLGGETYDVADLTSTGLTLSGVPANLAPAKEFTGKLHLLADDTDVLVQIEGEAESYDAETQTLVGRFDEASRHRVAGLAGALGMMPGVAPAAGAAPAQFSTQTVTVPAASNDKAIEDGGGFTVQRAVGLTLLGLFGFGVFAWVAGSVYDERFVIKASSAVVDAPVTRIRAPISGYYQSAVQEEGDTVQSGRPIAYIRTPTGGVTPIDSPCDCFVLDERKTRGQYVLTGEQLMTLAEAGQQIHITGYLPMSKIDDLRIGTFASIKFPTVTEPVPGVVTDIRAERTNVAAGLNAEPLARVTVRPARQLEQGDLGLPVQLSFDTFANSSAVASLPQGLRDRLFGAQPVDLAANSGPREAVAPEMLNDPEVAEANADDAQIGELNLRAQQEAAGEIAAPAAPVGAPTDPAGTLGASAPAAPAAPAAGQP
ncbi:MAG TPA: hypothetical protein VEH84_14210 [Alphaproteobacteria bacterium]|nr:hypothetical protein [Alphaproteobacteria bacterium]